ncbi:MAG: ribosome biogenesis GTPase YlqF [Acutalibacteraceae bacterium]|nr:ribosome biogenesis GTPase YlqF [Acutalibacteraceae bacterium]
MNDSQKQVVQWFPGHMAKTRRLIKESLPFVDLVTEIVDARIPMSSSNPELKEMIGNKPRIVLLNKCDVADEKATAKWVEYYKKNGMYAIPVDCRSGKGLNAYLPLVREVLKDKIQKNTEKGMVGKPLRVMVVGIPNTGKSSFINKMAGRNRAKVADKPGVTRSNSWFAVGNGVELLDTPGVLWPKFEDKAVGDKLAFIGSVKDEILDSEVLAMRLINVLKNGYCDRISERFKITGFEDKEDYEILEMIGRKRGMLISGGEIDTERASIMLLDEYRGGKLGRLTLEKPE